MEVVQKDVPHFRGLHEEYKSSESEYYKFQKWAKKDERLERRKKLPNLHADEHVPQNPFHYLGFGEQIVRAHLQILGLLLIHVDLRLNLLIVWAGLGFQLGGSEAVRIDLRSDVLDGDGWGVGGGGHPLHVIVDHFNYGVGI